MQVLSNTTNQNFTRARNVQIPDIYSRRFKSGKEDLDDMFGGAGFLPGMAFTLAAAPGTGKTSMLLQVLELLENTGKKTAYISGEENVEQLAFTSARLGVQQVPLANLTDIDEICDAIVKNDFDFVVLDSLPAINSRKRMNKRQLEEYVTTKLIKTAKEHEVVIGVILHFCKDGKSYKGSTLLPHSVDCNIIMTRNKDDYNLRDVDVTKNRFGTAGQAIFEMTPRGFNFEAVEQTEENAGGKKTSKSDAILSILDSPKTIAQIAQESGASGAYLTTLLRQLVNEGKAEKNGRGAEATYSKK
jgi:predicted ATP-dependent serine protease